MAATRVRIPKGRQPSVRTCRGHRLHGIGPRLLHHLQTELWAHFPPRNSLLAGRLVTEERFGFVPRAFFSLRLPNSVTYGISRAFPFRPSSGRSYCKPELIGNKGFHPHLWARRRVRVEEPFRSAPPEGRLAPSLGGVRVRWDRFGRPFPERESLP